MAPSYLYPHAWPNWVATQAMTTSSSNCWNVWVDTGTGSPYQYHPYLQHIWNGWQVPPTQDTLYVPVNIPLTQGQESERAASARRVVGVAARNDLIRRNRQRASALRRKPAERRAEQLLLEHLNETQREEWSKRKSFHVHTADGKRTYRIDYGLAGNVRLIESKEPVRGKHGYLPVGSRFCAHVYHPDGWVPNEDNVLAQKLLIEANEAEFLAMANVS